MASKIEYLLVDLMMNLQVIQRTEVPLSSPTDNEAFYGATTFCMMTLSVATLSVATLSLMTLSLTTLSLTTLSLKTFSLKTFK